MKKSGRKRVNGQICEKAANLRPYFFQFDFRRQILHEGQKVEHESVPRDHTLIDLEIKVINWTRVGKLYYSCQQIVGPCARRPKNPRN